MSNVNFNINLDASQGTQITVPFDFTKADMTSTQASTLFKVILAANPNKIYKPISAIVKFSGMISDIPSSNNFFIGDSTTTNAIVYKGGNIIMNKTLGLPGTNQSSVGAGIAASDLFPTDMKLEFLSGYDNPVNPSTMRIQGFAIFQVLDVI